MHHGIDRTHTAATNSVFATDEKSSIKLATHTSCDSDLQDESKNLRELLPNARFFSGDDVTFHSIAESAESATEGQLVVYRIGVDCPSRLVADAMARGAAGILTEQLLPCPLPQCIVGDLELAMAELAAHDLGRPDRQLLTIGVIGSAGKTTTSLLISSLLRSSAIRTAYCTDLGESDGVIQTTSQESLHSGRRLIEWLGDANDCQCRAAVVELTEEQARNGHYDAIEFDMIVVAGSSSGSDDFGPSFLQCALERLSRDGVVVAPADDAAATRAVLDAGARVVTYGVRKSADVTARIIDQSGGMTTLLVTHQDTTAVMETALCGPAMAANHAAAAMVGLLIAEPLHAVVEKLGQLRNIPGRGHQLSSFEQANVVIDAGGSPERAAAAMRTYRSMKGPGRLWCVVAIDAESSPETLARYGTHMERFGNHSIVTANSESRSKFLAASHHVLDGVEQCAAFRLVASRKRAIEWAIREADPKDTVLVITGEHHRSAHEQRSDLAQILNWVEEARQSISTTSSDADKPNLSIFG